MKNFRDGKFYSIEEKMAESTSYCNSNLEIEGFILDFSRFDLTD